MVGVGRLPFHALSRIPWEIYGMHPDESFAYHSIIGLETRHRLLTLLGCRWPGTAERPWQHCFVLRASWRTPCTIYCLGCFHSSHRLIRWATHVSAVSIMIRLNLFSSSSARAAWRLGDLWTSSSASACCWPIEVGCGLVANIIIVHYFSLAPSDRSCSSQICSSERSLYSGHHQSEPDVAYYHCLELRHCSSSFELSISGCWKSDFGCSCLLLLQLPRQEQSRYFEGLWFCYYADS